MIKKTTSLFFFFFHFSPLIFLFFFSMNQQLEVHELAFELEIDSQKNKENWR